MILYKSDTNKWKFDKNDEFLKNPILMLIHVTKFVKKCTKIQETYKISEV